MEVRDRDWKIQVSFWRSVEFFKESWQELKRVHWPTRKETYAATAVVLVLVLLISLFLAFVDFGLTRAIQSLLN
jgi:preprotein translocase subunit SecE|tara:strand:- start:178 stop:399 length:222 start_codon:yes stop_codon:yes gene_type:complete